MSNFMSQKYFCVYDSFPFKIEKVSKAFIHNRYSYFFEDIIVAQECQSRFFVKYFKNKSERSSNSKKIPIYKKKMLKHQKKVEVFRNQFPEYFI